MRHGDSIARHDPTRDRPLRGRLWQACPQVLLVLAFVGASYLAWVSLQNGPVAGCGEGSGCNQVLQTRWAYWLGIPVSLPAVFSYLCLLAASGVLASERYRQWHGITRLLVLGLGITVVGSALWFIGLQAIVIRAFCKFCMATHLCALMAIAILWVRIVASRTADRQPVKESSGRWTAYAWPINARTILGCILAGLCGTAVLVAGQVMVEKQSYAVVTPKPEVTPTTNRVPRLPYNLTRGSSASNTLTTAVRSVSTTNTAGENPTHAPSPVVTRKSPHVLSVHGGAFEFSLKDLPVIGSVDAPHVIISLTDYTCPHCREQHPKLIEAQKQLSNQVSILSLITPLSSNCNPVVKVFMAKHSNACEYARLALAVWRTKPEAFSGYDEWLFAAHQVPSVAEARNQAVQLVGSEPLDRALKDEWITHCLQTNGYLYKTNFLKMRSGVLPELMMGPAVTFGRLATTTELVQLLKKHLQLQ